MVNKDVGDERWAIRRDPSGFITGNVFRLDGGPPSFILCNPIGSGTAQNHYMCQGSNGCPTGTSVEDSGRGVSQPPKMIVGNLVLVNKDVAGQRWAITRDYERTISGNVFVEGAPPAFVTCLPKEERDNYRCWGADACMGEPCGYTYNLIGDVVLPSSFFEVPAGCIDEYRIIASDIEIPAEFFEVTDPIVRYVDNGDGTITDTHAGLQWEKKETADGSGEDYSNPHDVDNRYSWTADDYGEAPNGTAFTQFLAALNTPPCFAGHCDWRLPTSRGGRGGLSGDPAELDTLLLEPYPCSAPRGHYCIAPIFGDTNLAYWSASSPPENPNAWYVDFQNGEIRLAGKSFDLPVRAVRGPFGSSRDPARLR